VHPAVRWPEARSPSFDGTKVLEQDIELGGVLTESGTSLSEDDLKARALRSAKGAGVVVEEVNYVPFFGGTAEFVLRPIDEPAFMSEFEARMSLFFSFVRDLPPAGRRPVLGDHRRQQRREPPDPGRCPTQRRRMREKCRKGTLVRNRRELVVGSARPPCAGRGCVGAGSKGAGWPLERRWRPPDHRVRGARPLDSLHGFVDLQNPSSFGKQPRSRARRSVASWRRAEPGSCGAGAWRRTPGGWKKKEHVRPLRRLSALRATHPEFHPAVAGPGR
jgi:hypothetical protein